MTSFSDGGGLILFVMLCLLSMQPISVKKENIVITKCCIAVFLALTCTTRSNMMDTAACAIKVDQLGFLLSVTADPCAAES